MLQVYLDLALKALQAPSASAARGDHSDREIDGTQAPAPRPPSPESLLSRAELYTDRALAAGSGLPLARLVKGQALALRGQHKVKLSVSPTFPVATLFLFLPAVLIVSTCRTAVVF